MGTKLIILFFIVILVYLIAIIFQKDNSRNSIKHYLSNKDKKELIDAIEAVEIPYVEGWSEKDMGNGPVYREGSGMIY